ncbi:MAG: hypothetical protein HKO81_06395 [Flavobacteriaceae bacterium]|nr:hypothetical protein [Flavobacteriaceae bacterium]
MCTVTIFYKGKNDFILTSNRDESPQRESTPPKFYMEESAKLLYPKDKMSGGTWIGISDKNRLICLLNGGFEFHERKKTYQKSRGLIVKDLLASNNFSLAVKNYNFKEIEPFTIVTVDWNNGLEFIEVVWDGNELHCQLIPLRTQIWSSSTLYSKEMKKERHQWFSDYRSRFELNARSLFEFHSTETDNKDYGIIMNREFVKTTSITQVEKTNDILKMKYCDLKMNQNFINEFKLPISVDE